MSMQSSLAPRSPRQMIGRPAATRRSDTRHSDTRRNQSGFSLVELAIVLIIIGLIVGGVLKGQDLIESARVNSIQTQLNEVRVAFTTFQNKYDALPGDIDTPEIFVAAGSARGGDGNGRIDEERIGVAPDASEAVAFWHHLQLADLIGGLNLGCAAGDAVDSCADLDNTTGLQARIGGVYTVAWDEGPANDADDTFSNSFHWIMLGAYDATDSTTGFNDLPVLTPTQLRTIDQRSDDGRPETGFVQGYGDDGATTPVTCQDGTDNTYTADDLNQACYAAFRL